MSAPDLMFSVAADACDGLDERAYVAEGQWFQYGGRKQFSGPASTVLAFEDNSSVKDALAEPGRGRVLVVDGGGSPRVALVGGNLAAMAHRNGWAGVVVHGAVRDVAELRAADVGICALGRCPRRSSKRNAGARDVRVEVGRVAVEPGAWVVADEDGVVILSPGDGPPRPRL